MRKPEVTEAPKVGGWASSVGEFNAVGDLAKAFEKAGDSPEEAYVRAVNSVYGRDPFFLPQENFA